MNEEKLIDTTLLVFFFKSLVFFCLSCILGRRRTLDLSLSSVHTRTACVTFCDYSWTFYRSGYTGFLHTHTCTGCLSSSSPDDMIFLSFSYLLSFLYTDTLGAWTKNGSIHGTLIIISRATTEFGLFFTTQRRGLRRAWNVCARISFSSFQHTSPRHESMCNVLFPFLHVATNFILPLNSIWTCISTDEQMHYFTCFYS